MEDYKSKTQDVSLCKEQGLSCLPCCWKGTIPVTPSTVGHTGVETSKGYCYLLDRFDFISLCDIMNSV